MRFRAAVLTLGLAVVVLQTGVRGDVGSTPRWVVFGGAYDVVEHDGKVYLAGGFTHLYRANSANHQVLDPVTAALKPGCARVTDPLRPLVDIVSDRAGGLFVPTVASNALANLVDVNGGFQPAPTTRFLRIRPDCTFDRPFQPPSVDPGVPNGGISSIYGDGSVVLATTSGQFSGIAGIAGYNVTTGQRLGFREYPQASHVEFLGPGAPGTVVVLLDAPGTRALAHLNLATLELGTPVLAASNRRYWYRAGRIFVWELPPQAFSGDWSRPLVSIDSATLQPTAGWTDPVPLAKFVSGTPTIPGGFTDIEVVGNRVFIGGSDRVNGQTVPAPAALDLATGIVDASWAPPALANQPGVAGTPHINVLDTDGTRLFFTAINLGRVGSDTRINFAALDAATGAVDPWAPAVLPAGQSFAALHAFTGGLFVEGISGIEGQERRYLAAVDAATGVLIDWNPYATVSNPHGLTALAANQTHLYVSAQLTGAVHRIPFATGILDSTWSLSLTRGLGAGARSLVADDTTLYMGGAFESVTGTGPGSSFPQTTRRSAAALSLSTGQLTAWNPNLSAPSSLDGVSAMARAGTTMFVGGNFTTTTYGAFGLIGVNLTTGGASLAPPSGLTNVTSVTTDGTRAFAAGRTGAGDALVSVHPGGPLAATPLTMPPFGSQRITHFRGRLYAERERDDVTLQPTASPIRFGSAWSATDGVVVFNDGVAYHPFAEPAAPNAPQNLAAQTSGNTVSLSWSAPQLDGDLDAAPAGIASSYVVRAGSAPGLSNLANFDTGSLTTGLSASAPNGTYYVRVHAKNAFGLSPPSNEIHFTLGPPTCTGVPPAPGTLAASVTGLSVTLTWGLAASATSYILEAGAVSGGKELAVVNVGATSAFSASAPAGVYYVRVRGSNACGNGAASNEVKVTLGTPVTLPGPPTNLAFTRSGNNVTLTWKPPVTGGVAVSYVLEVGSAPGLSNLAVVPLAGTALNANAPAGSYYVRVRAVNSAGQGPPSSEVRVDVP